MNQPVLSRKLPLLDQDQSAALAMLVYSLPRLETLDLHALATFPGLGEQERVGHVLASWEDYACEYCFVAGHNMRERTAYSLAVPDLQQRFGCGPTQGLITQLHAEHTGEQAAWLADQLDLYAVRSVGLFLPPYHMLRAWRTLVKEVVFKRGLWMPIYPLPLATSPFEVIPEYQPEDSIAKWEMIPGELERIRRYEAKGHIATFKETLQYLEWLWQCT